MKRFSIIITLIILTLFASYLGYDYFLKPNKSVGLLSFVPESASFVYDVSNFSQTWNTLIESALWKSLRNIKSVEQVNAWFIKIDSLQKGSIDRLTKKGFLLSWHRTSKNKSDLVFYIDSKSNESQKTLGQILNLIKEDSQVVARKRIYQGFEIQELRLSGQTSFSYIIYENTFIGSYTPFLVEDVIRLIIDNFDGGFYSEILWFKSIPKLGNDEGNIFINVSRLDDLGKTLSNNSGISNFANACYFDSNIDHSNLLLSGFAETTSGHYLNTLNDQSPQKNNFKYFFSNNTGYFIQIGIQDGLKWHSNLLDYWNLKNKRFLDERLSFASTYSFDFERAYSWIGKGIALSFQPNLVHDEEKVVLVDTKDMSEALNHLNLFSESLYHTGDSVYIEQFDEITIREIKVSDFPYFVWGSFFQGFDKTFYAVIDDYLVFAERIDAIKSLLADIEMENTLGRSVDYSAFESTTLEESNFKVVINTSVIMDQLAEEGHGNWQNFVVQNQPYLNDFKYVGIDFSALDDNFYANISFSHTFSESLKTDDSEAISGTSIALNYPIASKPYVVRNHNDNSREVIIQDSLNYIMLISAQGDKLWEKEIDDHIVSGIHQIDYYKNGKLQYFFTTSDQMYLIDRLGNTVEDFPKSVEFRIAGAQVIDYDKSKRYRFLMNDERGNLYLFTKEGISLSGWDPKLMQDRLASEPFHLRVRGQDMIVALQHDGTVNVFNRRGVSKDGFPLKLEGRFNSDIHVKMGDDLSTTELSVVSKNGLLSRFNLLGQIVTAKQLYRPNEESAFRLVVDALKKTFIIVRKDFNRLVFINDGGEEFLSKDYLSDDGLSIQYYNFSRTNQLYVVTDLVQGFSYIYDSRGILITSRPINSQFDVSMMYYKSRKSYEIFVTSENTFRRLSF